jgi:hypothetical protein
MKSYSGTIENGIIRATVRYEWKGEEPKEYGYTFRVVPMDSEDCVFWYAADGEVGGLADVGEATCMANAESALRGIGKQNIYVTWKPKASGPDAIKRWKRKWEKQTARPPLYKRA